MSAVTPRLSGHAKGIRTKRLNKLRQDEINRQHVERTNAQLRAILRSREPMMLNWQIKETWESRLYDWANSPNGLLALFLAFCLLLGGSLVWAIAAGHFDRRPGDAYTGIIDGRDAPLSWSSPLSITRYVRTAP